MQNKLEYKDLLNMVGSSVLVKDIANPELCDSEICIVDKMIGTALAKQDAFVRDVDGIILVGDTYAYEYYADGTCFEGEFEVYEIED